MSQHPRPLLIVEDDPAICATIADQLADGGEFAPTAAESLNAARTALGSKGARFDGILLDLGLPDGDGGEFCAQLRRQGVRTPIIMLTGRDSERDIIQGLDAGANDYVLKPFRTSELLARLRAQLRAFDNSEDAVFDIGPFQFRPSLRMLEEVARNRRIRLTDLECRLLKRLQRSRGETVSRKELMEEVWGYRSGTATHTLETHIYRLRQKLEACPPRPKLLLSENRGYRLNMKG